MDRQTTMRSQNDASAGSGVRPNGTRSAACKAGAVVTRRKGRRPACDPAVLEALRRQVEAEPDLSVAERRARLAAKRRPVPSRTTVWRRLKELRPGTSPEGRPNATPAPQGPSREKLTPTLPGSGW
jgi:hypothetical protein